MKIWSRKKANSITVNDWPITNNSQNACAAFSQYHALLIMLGWLAGRCMQPLFSVTTCDMEDSMEFLPIPSWKSLKSSPFGQLAWKPTAHSGRQGSLRSCCCVMLKDVLWQDNACYYFHACVNYSFGRLSHAPRVLWCGFVSGWVSGSQTLCDSCHFWGQPESHAKPDTPIEADPKLLP